MFSDTYTAFEVLRNYEPEKPLALAVLRGVQPVDLIKAWYDFQSDYGGSNPYEGFARNHNLTLEYATAALDAGRELCQPVTPESSYPALERFRKYTYYGTDEYKKWEED